MSELSRNKQIARSYFQAVNTHDPKQVEPMVCENYIQHNPFVPTGRAAFVNMLPRLAEHNSIIENIRMLQDGEFIVMHHRWKNAQPFGFNQTAAFHIIRLNDLGVVAEHWNVMAEDQKLNKSGRTMLDGETLLRDFGKTESNKETVKKLFSQLSRETCFEFLSSYFDRELIQHHQDIADGLAELQNILKSQRLRYSGQHVVLGEANFVLSVSEGFLDDTHSAFYDLFRLAEGKIQEHWSITQEIPSENLANSNTMFGF